MRSTIRLVFAAIAVVAVCSAARYPERPIRLIVPYPEGGGADYWGRLVAKKLSDSLGKPVVVENIPGAGGNKGTAIAAAAKPDGYTLLLGSVGPLAVHPYTYATLAFDAEKSFIPISMLESSPILLVAHPGVEAASAEQLISAARAQPDSLSYASNGNGSPEQVAGELFKKRANVQIRHIPYDGAGPARKAVLARQASLMFDPCKGALPAIRQGNQKALAVATASRLAALPDVPTFAEIGVPQYELRIWTGILAPAGASDEIVTKISHAVQEILRTPEIRKEIADEGGEAATTTPEQFATFITAERARWSALVRESGIPKVQ